MELSTTPRRTEIPAGTGRAFRVAQDERFRVVDLAGGQVGDVFAFVPADDGRTLREHHSAQHTRAHGNRVFPAVGGEFVTNRRRPILTLLADDSPGYHDMLIAACDPERYAALGSAGHASCAGNLHDALAGLGLTTEVVPQPVNVFMRIPIEADGRLRWLPAATAPGDSITFRAATDCVVAVSACPQDLVGINGGTPTALAVEIQPGH